MHPDGIIPAARERKLRRDAAEIEVVEASSADMAHTTPARVDLRPTSGATVVVNARLAPAQLAKNIIVRRIPADIPGYAARPLVLCERI